MQWTVARVAYVYERRRICFFEFACGVGVILFLEYWSVWSVPNTSVGYTTIVEADARRVDEEH